LSAWDERLNMSCTLSSSCLDGDGLSSGCVCQSPMKWRPSACCRRISFCSARRLGRNEWRVRQSDRRGPVAFSIMMSGNANPAKICPPASRDHYRDWRYRRRCSTAATAKTRRCPEAPIGQIMRPAPSCTARIRPVPMAVQLRTRPQDGTSHLAPRHRSMRHRLVAVGALAQSMRGTPGESPP
jgi:hypothetical protein